MADRKLVNINGLANTLRVSRGWLKAEADAGRIPCLKAGRKLLFNPEAVELVLSERAATARDCGASTEGTS